MKNYNKSNLSLNCEFSRILSLERCGSIQILNKAKSIQDHFNYSISTRNSFKMNQKVLVLNSILVLSLVISVRGRIGYNCPTGCKYSKAAEQCQPSSGIVKIAGCENYYDDYCDCVAEKHKWCVVGWCPFENKPDSDCKWWQLWC